MAGQYKNCKNFLNLCHHESDFGLDAEWNFFATSHGKGPCDGVGGTVKRLAARASLQRPYDRQILTPQALFEFAEEEIKKISFTYCTVSDYENEEQLLRDRHGQAQTIAGTQKLHYFKPIGSNTVMVKQFSSLPTFEVKKVSNTFQSLTDEEVIGYVTVNYDQKWWLAYVLEKNNERKEAKVTFLSPNGPAPSFVYPNKPDVLMVPYSDILTRSAVTTASGRTYHLSVTDQTRASRALSNL